MPCSNSPTRCCAHRDRSRRSRRYLGATLTRQPQRSPPSPHPHQGQESHILSMVVRQRRHVGVDTREIESARPRASVVLPVARRSDQQNDAMKTTPLEWHFAGFVKLIWPERGPAETRHKWGQIRVPFPLATEHVAGRCQGPRLFVRFDPLSPSSSTVAVHDPRNVSSGWRRASLRPAEQVGAGRDGGGGSVHPAFGVGLGPSRWPFVSFAS